MIKKVDIFTVVISSCTLLLFCLCSYWLLLQYSDIKTGESRRANTEISQTTKAIKQLSKQTSVDRQAIIRQLENNKQLMQAAQNEWLLLKQTLSAFISMLFFIVVVQLFFVWILFRSSVKSKS